MDRQSIFTAITIVLLCGCGPSLEDARKLGFASLEEMKEIQGMGYKDKQEYNERYKKFGFESIEQMEKIQRLGFSTMNEYKEVKSLSAEFFSENCKEASSDDYIKYCLGTKIFWKGIIVKSGTPWGANIKVLNDNGEEPTNSFTIDSESIQSSISESDQGKLIEFIGIVGKQNVVSPDIESVSYVALESDSDRSARLSSARLRVEEQKQENEKKAALSEYPPAGLPP